MVDVELRCRLAKAPGCLKFLQTVQSKGVCLGVHLKQITSPSSFSLRSQSVARQTFLHFYTPTLETSLSKSKVRTYWSGRRNSTRLSASSKLSRRGRRRNSRPRVTGASTRTLRICANCLQRCIFHRWLRRRYHLLRNPLLRNTIRNYQTNQHHPRCLVL